MLEEVGDAVEGANEMIVARVVLATAVLEVADVAGHVSDDLQQHELNTMTCISFTNPNDLTFFHLREWTSVSMICV